MSKRNQPSTPNLDTLEGIGNTETIESMPPPGVPAAFETKVRWQRDINPSDVPAQARNYSDELRQLASEELGVEPPLDPLSAFCEAWADYSGCLLSITRLPDPTTRRTPRNQYNRPCLEIESLGTIPFDPNNLVFDLQIANDNSGGAFRLFLRDHNNQRIQDAYLDRVVIPDPLRDHNSRRRRHDDDYEDERPRYREREQPATPPKSEDEIMLANAKNQLFATALARALEPPRPAEPANPLTQLSPEDQLAFGLLKQGNTLQTVIEKIATITNQPDRIDPSPTWKDRLTDAGINLVTQNPAIIAQTTDIITRAATAILSAFAPKPMVINEPMPIVTPQPVRHPPVQRAQQIIPAQAVNGLPETNQPEDDPFNDEDSELIMLEELTKLMLSTKPLRLDDPVIQDLRAEYPTQFDAALKTITATPSLLIINYICRKSEWAAEMFNSPITGPHLKKRLEELKTLIKLPPEVQAQINAAAQQLMNPDEINPESSIDSETEETV